ncbi:class II glutamine amidotransferase [Athalassotoga saccharophila]|uniref:class II glutamine amidotransferase n=1 Tax=Athalassotoga saccharophila TaxID=1441386 RepID=UPI001E2C93DD|nr:class II glutamine amidotransferase [Athalassotoga saccharophila]
MIGFISTKSCNISPYIDFLKNQAIHGKGAPHPDGWGMSCYDRNDLLIKKSSDPIWKTGTISVDASAAIIHARKASFGKANLLFSHPFIFEKKGKIWSFAHNGTIYNLSGKKEKNEIDTQFYAKRFIENLKQDPVRSVENTIRELVEISENKFTSMNAIISSGEILLGVRYVKEDEDGYHTLFYFEEDDRISISTEPLDSRWVSLKSGEFVMATVNSRVEFVKGTIKV